MKAYSIDLRQKIINFTRLVHAKYSGSQIGEIQ